MRYITQARNRPPTFIVFGSRTDLLPESYRRYLVNSLRRELDYGAVPVRLTFRGARNPFGEAQRKSAARSVQRPGSVRGPGGDGTTRVAARRADRPARGAARPSATGPRAGGPRKPGGGGKGPRPGR